jgi:hypothetical protein
MGVAHLVGGDLNDVACPEIERKMDCEEVGVATGNDFDKYSIVQLLESAGYIDIIAGVFGRGTPTYKNTSRLDTIWASPIALGQSGGVEGFRAGWTIDVDKRLSADHRTVLVRVPKPLDGQELKAPQKQVDLTGSIRFDIRDRELDRYKHLTSEHESEECQGNKVRRAIEAWKSECIVEHGGSRAIYWDLATWITSLDALAGTGRMVLTKELVSSAYGREAALATTEREKGHMARAEWELLTFLQGADCDLSNSRLKAHAATAELDAATTQAIGIAQYNVQSERPGPRKRSDRTSGGKLEVLKRLARCKPI